MNKRIKSFFSPLLIKRIKKFRSFKRGYYSLLIIGIAYLLSFFAEFIINDKALLVKFDGKKFVTLYSDVSLKKFIFAKAIETKENYFKYKNIPATDTLNLSDEKFITLKAEYERYDRIKKDFDNHRVLRKIFEEQKRGDWVILVPYSYGPNENLLDELGDRNPPTGPDRKNFLGTDDRGRDVLARLVYGFRIYMTFSLLLTLTSYIIGIFFGAILGYYGGKVDFLGLRFIEIWASIPFLFTVMVISSIMIPNFTILIVILSLFYWISMARYIRAEFLREKSNDYVQAAVAVGVSDRKIILSHILPNSLTPAISFLPFTIISGIAVLASLDFLGFGLPEPTPSWGQLLSQGISNLSSWWLTFSPMAAMFLTLMLIAFIGEAVREALDPKIYSRMK
ncbi:ABC transporter permease subunit [candidate division WOR-3 bacterium]|nr:ABC transporter permease subunit [candidate division WOR-3 bacterium]